MQTYAPSPDHWYPADADLPPDIPAPEVHHEEHWRDTYRHDLRHYVAGQQLARQILGNEQHAYPGTDPNPSPNMLNALENAFADPEPDIELLDRVFDATPGLQDWIVSTFSSEDSPRSVAQIASSRLFIDKVAGDAFEQLPKSRKESRKMVEAEDGPLPEQLAKLQTALLNHSGFTKEEQREITEAWFEPAGNMLSIWRKFRKYAQEEVVERAQWHLLALGSLYRHNTEAPRRLRQEYGIRNFGRYDNPSTDSSLLLPQLAEDYIGNGNVALTAVMDHNGAFDEAAVEADAIKLEEPTFLEARTPIEALKLLLQLNRQGHLPPIQRLFAGAHGSKEHIGDLTLQQVKKFKGLDRLKVRLFSKDAEIVLASCQTGKRGGIAHKLAKRTGITTFAPRISPTSIEIDNQGQYRYVNGKAKATRKAKHYRGRYMPSHAVRR